MSRVLRNLILIVTAALILDVYSRQWNGIIHALERVN
jgi:hypothetical protein